MEVQPHFELHLQLEIGLAQDFALGLVQYYPFDFALIVAQLLDWFGFENNFVDSSLLTVVEY